MNEIFELKEGLIQLFSDNPINWVKWLLVFASFIFTFIVIIKFDLIRKLDPQTRLDKKVQKAIEKNHIIEAKAIKKWIGYETNQNGIREKTASGKYEYEINGKKYKYIAHFSHNYYPRTILHLYYDKNPKRVFTNEEYHYYAISSIPSAIIVFLPLLVAAFMVWILGLAI